MLLTVPDRCGSPRTGNSTTGHLRFRCATGSRVNEWLPKPGSASLWSYREGALHGVVVLVVSVGAQLSGQ